jgi:hypothetical protein
MSKFIEIEYTAKQKALKATDSFLLRAWEIFCEKKHGKVTVDLIRALCSIENKTTVKGISANTAFTLEWDVEPPSDGASLYPDEFQPWEREGKQLCIRNADSSFSLTDHGAMIKDLLVAEIKKHYLLELERLSTNKHSHQLEV